MLASFPWSVFLPHCQPQEQPDFKELPSLEANLPEGKKWLSLPVLFWVSLYLSLLILSVCLSHLELFSKL